MVIISHFAYLDAGTGSLIVQSVIGAAAGVVVFGRKLIAKMAHQIKSIFSRGKEAPTPSTPVNKNTVEKTPVAKKPSQKQ